jgi:hypothetical protein
LGLLFDLISDTTLRSRMFRASLAALSIGRAAYKTRSASSFILWISCAYSLTAASSSVTIPLATLASLRSPVSLVIISSISIDFLSRTGYSSVRRCLRSTIMLLASRNLKSPLDSFYLALLSSSCLRFNKVL